MPPDMYRVPPTLDPQRECGYSVTSPQLPELLTEGDTVDEALANALDAFAAVLEIYQEEGPPLPPVGPMRERLRGHLPFGHAR